ncbi:hypothetical protein [Haloglomus halophilum]|uniref:hypothetical protein n=1 Tax=Haloglomus halophilum TaxID=2962672 RepID=UPI0020C98696|nr:hypothetical protein [Haloglomus halophilum]
MKPPRTRRLIVGGSVLLVAGWLGLMALVAPALIGAVAAATTLPLALVLLPYAAVRIATQVMEPPRWPLRATPDGDGVEGADPGTAEA